MKPRPTYVGMFLFGATMAAALTLALIGGGIFADGAVLVAIACGGFAGVGAAKAAERLATRQTALGRVARTPAAVAPLLFAAAVTTGCLVLWPLHADALTLGAFVDWTVKPAAWLLALGLPLATLIGAAFGFRPRRWAL